MIQPNFSELEWRLQGALDLMAIAPEARSTRDYATRVDGLLTHFRETTRQTDVTYHGWRAVREEQMKAFRALRRTLDAGRALADEHAMDDMPASRISYTDEDDIIAATTQVIGWLQTHDGLWPWIAAIRDDLSGQLAHAQALKQKERVEFQRYTVAGRSRIDAYDDAFGTYRDYVRDARNDVGHLQQFEALRLRVD